jgi:hypothetical protein
MTNDVVAEVSMISPQEYASQPVFRKVGFKPTHDRAATGNPPSNEVNLSKKWSK